MTEQERWQPTAGYPGYRISDQGRVWSEITHKFIQIRTDRRGYHVVQVRQDGISRNVFVHRLVAAAFVEGEGPEVRHLDGDPARNVPANLAWGSHAENMGDMVRHGRHSYANRTHCPHGHPYDEANTIVAPLKRGGFGRTCRACQAGQAEAKSIRGKQQGACTDCGKRMRRYGLPRHQRAVHQASDVLCVIEADS